MVYIPPPSMSPESEEAEKTSETRGKDLSQHGPRQDAPRWAQSERLDGGACRGCGGTRLDFTYGGSTRMPQSPHSWAVFGSWYSKACGISCPHTAPGQILGTPHSPGADPGHIHDAAVTQNICGTPPMGGTLRAHSIIFIL